MISVLKTPSMRYCHVVHIAEIDRVLPRLKPNCFLDGKNMRLSSKILTKGPTKPWFRVPHVTIDYMEIYGKVLEEQFPGIIEDATLVHEQVGQKAATGNQTKEAKHSHDKSALDTVNTLRQALADEEELSDWEDMVGDSDDESVVAEEREDYL